MCVWAHLLRLCEAEPGWDAEREIEIDPGMMADRKSGEHRTREEEGKRGRVMAAAVCVSALTML